MRMEQRLEYHFLDLKKKKKKNQPHTTTTKPFSLYIPVLVGGHFLALVKWRRRDVRIMIVSTYFMFTN